jgi:hypothetical protein
MKRTFFYCSILFLLSFFSVVLTGLSNNFSVLPEIISKPLKYISNDFVKEISLLKYLTTDVYSVSNDIAYSNLPKDLLSRKYYLDWSYHSNDTFYVERLLVPNDTKKRKLYFTKDFLSSLLYEYSWNQDCGEIISKDKINVRPKHFLFNDIGVIYNIKHGPLICSDSSNSILWKNTDFIFHHSIEKDENGNVWACGLSKFDLETYNNLKYGAIPFYIVLVDYKTGKTLFAKSIIDILEKSNLNWMLTWKSLKEAPNDYHHLNDIQPILEDNLFSKKGDLLISLREMNMIFLYDINLDTVKFYTFNLSNAQHDVDIYNDSCISVFSNNSYNKNSDDYTNSIEILNLINNKKRTFHKEKFKKFKINTSHQGLCEIIDKNTFMVEETEHGIIFIFENNKLKTYFFPSETNNATMLNWSRISEIKEER